MSSSGVFSVGYDFKYWLDDKDDDYYIAPKYKDFKKEILEYKHIDADIYQVYREILEKAQLFYHTKLAKSIVAPGYDGAWSKYNINFGNRISMDCLISLILYCDYSLLCSHFSGTFRALSRLNQWQHRQEIHIIGYHGN